MKRLLAQVLQGVPHLAGLHVDDGGADRAAGPQPVALLAHRLGQVEGDGGRQEVVLAGDAEQRLAGVGLEVGGVDGGETPAAQPPGGGEVEQVEGVSAGGLVGLVVADQGAEEVGGEHLGRPEVLAREGGLAGAGRADEQHQRRVGQSENH